MSSETLTCQREEAAWNGHLLDSAMVETAAYCFEKEAVSA